MDLRALKYFTAVYEALSISAAAKSCFVAQPSISAAIRQLETTLGQALFERHARGVKPTLAGQQLYPLAKNLLSDANAIQQVFNQENGKIAFRLGLIKALGVERMSELLKDFTSAIDGIELTLSDPDEEVDARIVTAKDVKNSEIFQPMWRDEFVLALPIGHPLSLTQKIGIELLDGIRFILRSPCEAWQDLSEILARNAIQVDCCANIQTVEYALGLVNAGVGCALVPNNVTLSDQHSVIFRKLHGVELTRSIGLAYDKKISPSPALETLKQICQRQQRRLRRFR